MIQFLKKLFYKDRKDHRYPIQNGTLVVVVPTKDGTKIHWKVNVIDISSGGAAFTYEGSPDDLAKSGLIKFSKDMPEAAEFKTISDVECSAESAYRRRGVKFEWKGVLGQKQFGEFVKEHGIQDSELYKKN